MSRTSHIFSIFLKQVKHYLWELYGHFEVQTAQEFLNKTTFSLYMGEVIHTICRAIMNTFDQNRPFDENESRETISLETPKYIPGGQQAIAALYGCTRRPASPREVHTMARAAVDEMQAHVIENCEGFGFSRDRKVQSSGHGLEESSAFAHYITDRDEHGEELPTGTVYADIFTCGTVDPFVGIQDLRRNFGAACTHVLYHNRGKTTDIPSLHIVLNEKGHMEYASTGADEYWMTVNEADADSDEHSEVDEMEEAAA